ncbi:MAG: YqiA/YcfP family alpha/beta fold hydrolase [Lautropia sp.]|nr:YqiA/YcfP family alpha/beta fold hydrolase [Lautropia sp.]
MMQRSRQDGDHRVRSETVSSPTTATTPASGRLIYLHGFRSSPQSFKGRLLRERMAALGRVVDYAAPALPPSPAKAIALVEQRLQPGPADTLVGSSLGGFYAIWLAERHGCRAVLLNPAVEAPRDLATQVGPQTGYHDCEAFEFLPEYVDQLQALKVAVLTRVERYFLIAAEGDEVLDWREMVVFCQGARQRVLRGGDHGLSDFADYVDEVLAFAGVPVSEGGRSGSALA